MRTTLRGCRRGVKRAPGPPSEAGFTLVEILIVIPVLIVVTSLVLTTLMSAYGAESRVQSTAQASSQVTLAFMALDTGIRYAADINQPGQDSDSPPDYFVEFQSDWTQDTQTQITEGQPVCTQVEYDNSTGELLQRSWDADDSVPTGSTGWEVLASELKTPLSSDPFSLSTPQSSPWQLTVAISAVVGSGSSKGTAQSDFTITSLDTTSSSSDEGICGGTP